MVYFRKRTKKPKQEWIMIVEVELANQARKDLLEWIVKLNEREIKAEMNELAAANWRINKPN